MGKNKHKKLCNTIKKVCEEESLLKRKGMGQISLELLYDAICSVEGSIILSDAKNEI